MLFILYRGRSSRPAETPCRPTLWAGRECSPKWSRMLFWPKRRWEPAIGRLRRLRLSPPRCQLYPRRHISPPAAAGCRTPGLSPCCRRLRTEPGRAPRPKPCSRTAGRIRSQSREWLAVSKLAGMRDSAGDHCHSRGTKTPVMPPCKSMAGRVRINRKPT